ncbi:hypothetical protein NHX12_013576 [Muraenolepis orangiensis]|uniref:Uncharacterized protein n=1 Tax=Muraenolepis orangiensis TaxID=630683 RepID=A0A9Q0DC14_9TELE|nr:hypothetical protein NHX12_013576 [Muraenolepis orangiensis]
MGFFRSGENPIRPSLSLVVEPPVPWSLDLTKRFKLLRLHEYVRPSPHAETTTSRFLGGEGGKFANILAHGQRYSITSHSYSMSAPDPRGPWGPQSLHIREGFRMTVVVGSSDTKTSKEFVRRFLRMPVW